MKKSFLFTLSFLLVSISLLAQNEKDSTESVNFKRKVTSEPLVIINGEISSTGIKWIDPNSIKSISILKDQSAIAVFGEAGRNGVIVVTINDKSKSDTTEDMLGYVVKEQHSFKGNQLNEALVMINGEVSSTGLKWIDPKRIKSISILKDQPAIAVFGEAGRNGVIVVTADDYQTLINK